MTRIDKHEEAPWFGLVVPVNGIGGDIEEHRPRVAVFATGEAPPLTPCPYWAVFLRGPNLATALWMVAS